MLSQLKSALHRNPALVGALRSTYPALHWVTNQPAVYSRVAPYLREMEFDEVRLSGRGNEPEAHLRRTTSMMPLVGKDILVLGVGAGDELTLWERQHARSVVATDFFVHGDPWTPHAATRFAQADVRALPFADASFDVVASTALFEHVDRVDDAAAEMARITRPGGVVFANFGPLYHTYGGAHFEGAYEHLWMSDAQLDAYLVERNIPIELNDGLLWLRNGMFSRLTYDEHLAIFRRHFDIDHLTLTVSQDALRYKRTHPAAWAALTARHPERDLLTFAMTVWMRPKPRVSRSAETILAPAWIGAAA